MGSTLDLKKLANELKAAFDERRTVQPPSARDPGFGLQDAYAVEAELVRMRVASGRTTVGVKIGAASRAIWRVANLETLTWAHLYDNTVQFAAGNAASLSIGKMIAPKIEPEIVVKLREPVAGTDAAAILSGVEWIALGFEICDCVYPDWQCQTVDSLAAYGMHAALVVGEPRTVTADLIPTLVDQLPRFKVRLTKNGKLVEEGVGANVMDSPALCLGELARVGTPAPGMIVSTGSLTPSAFIAPGEEWSAEVEGIELPRLTVRVE
jgi:2-oxo-3-hexenedioate decarboxylase